MYDNEFIDDLEKTRKVSKKEMDEIFETGSSEEMLEMLRRKKGIDEHHLENALKYGDEQVRRRVARHPNSSEKVLTTAYHDPRGMASRRSFGTPPEMQEHQEAEQAAREIGDIDGIREARKQMDTVIDQRVQQLKSHPWTSLGTNYNYISADVMKRNDAPQAVMEHAAEHGNHWHYNTINRKMRSGSQEVGGKVYANMLKNTDLAPMVAHDWHHGGSPVDALSFEERDKFLKAASKELDLVRDGSSKMHKGAIKNFIENVPNNVIASMPNMMEDLVDAGHTRALANRHAHPSAMDTSIDNLGGNQNNDLMNRLKAHIVGKKNPKDIAKLLTAPGVHLPMEYLEEIKDMPQKSIKKALARHVVSEYGKSTQATKDDYWNRPMRDRRYQMANDAYQKLYDEHVENYVADQDIDHAHGTDEYFEERERHREHAEDNFHNNFNQDELNSYMHDAGQDYHGEFKDLVGNLLNDDEDFKDALLETHTESMNNRKSSLRHNKMLDGDLGELVEDYHDNLLWAQPKSRLLETFARHVPPHANISDEMIKQVFGEISNPNPYNQYQHKNHVTGALGILSNMAQNREDGGFDVDMLADVAHENVQQLTDTTGHREIDAAMQHPKQVMDVLSQLQKISNDPQAFKDKVGEKNPLAKDAYAYSEAADKVANSNHRGADIDEHTAALREQKEAINNLAKHIDPHNLNAGGALALGLVGQEPSFQESHGELMQDLAASEHNGIQNYALANMKDLPENLMPNAIREGNWQLLGKLYDRPDKGGIAKEDMMNIVDNASNSLYDEDGKVKKNELSPYSSRSPLANLLSTFHSREDSDVRDAIEDKHYAHPSIAPKLLNHPDVKDETLDKISDAYTDEEGGRDAPHGVEAILRAHGRESNPNTISITPNAAKLREMRHHVNEAGGSIHKKDLEKLGFSPGQHKVSHLLDGKGHLSSDKLDEHIDTMPKLSYGVTHGDERNYGQQHDGKMSKAFQLHITGDQVKALKEAGVWDKYTEVISHSEGGHPQRAGTGIGWVRYSHGDDGVHIDEIQSDIYKSIRNKMEDWAKSGEHSEVWNNAHRSTSPDEVVDHMVKRGMIGEGERDTTSHGGWQFDNAARDIVKKKYMSHKRENGIEDDADKVAKIIFGGKHPSEVLHEGLLQHLRDEGHDGKEVHIWKPHSKATISLGGSTRDLPAHFKAGYGQIPKKLGYQDAKYGDLADTQSGDKHKGKDTWKHTLKKYSIIDYICVLEKAQELIDDDMNSEAEMLLSDFGMMDNIMKRTEVLAKSQVAKKTKIRIEEEADGKKEIDYGEEELDKSPNDAEGAAQANHQDAIQDEAALREAIKEDKKKKKKRSKLAKTWEMLKARLDSEKALLDMEDASGMTEEKEREEEEAAQQEQMAQEQGQEGEEGEAGMEEAMQAAMEQEGGEEGAEMAEGQEGAEGEEGGESEEELQAQLEALLGGEGEEQSEGEGAPLEGEAEQEIGESEAGPGEQGEEGLEEGEQVAEEMEAEGASEAEVEDSLRHLGYSDEEIAYIVDGVHQHHDQLENAKTDVQRAKLQHEDIKAQNLQERAEHEREIKSSKAEHEQSLKEREQQVALEHKRKMNALEHRYAQKEKEKALGKYDHEADSKKFEQDMARKEKEYDLKMKEMELEFAQKERELELEFKKQELELKLKHAEADHQRKQKEKDVASKDKMAQKKAEAKEASSSVAEKKDS